MKDPDAFDVTIDTLHKARQVPAELIQSAVYLRDALEIAQLVANRVFGDGADPHVVLDVYDRLNAERVRRTTRG